MAKATIVRTGAALPQGSALDAARQFVFGLVKGLRQDDDRFWNRFWRKITTMEPGELFTLEAIFPRNSKFHRRFFAMLNVGFEAWEPPRKHKTYKGKPIAKNFESFREDVLILAGFCDQTFDLKGRFKLTAKSISFANMDDVEFEAVYSAVADVLLEQVLTNYLGRAELDEVVSRVMEFHQ